MLEVIQILVPAPAPVAMSPRGSLSVLSTYWATDEETSPKEVMYMMAVSTCCRKAPLALLVQVHNRTRGNPVSGTFVERDYTRPFQPTVNVQNHYLVQNELLYSWWERHPWIDGWIRLLPVEGMAVCRAARTRKVSEMQASRLQPDNNEAPILDTS